jgi:hypothetical protein
MLCGVVACDNATYSCPWVKIGRHRSIPTCVTDCPCDLLIVIANANFTGNWQRLKINGNYVEDEDRIRKFASSLYYPVDSDGDLTIRLGLPMMSNNKRYDTMVDLTEEAILDCFIKAMDDHSNVSNARDTFSNIFCNLVEGPCHNILIKEILKSMIKEIERIISLCSKMDASKWLESFPHLGLLWILTLLSKTGCAEGLVECVFQSQMLCDIVYH